jgi:hypothetical protein
MTTYYVILRNTTVDKDDATGVLGVYTSREEADAAFAEAVKQEKEWVADQWDWIIGIDDKGYFSAGEAGWYSGNHTKLEICVVVQDDAATQ